MLTRLIIISFELWKESHLETCKMSTDTLTLTNVSSEEAAALLEEFITLDKDGNGMVSTDELEALLRSMRLKLMLSETDIKQTLRKIDPDGDGTIEITELNQVLEKYGTKGCVYKALSQRAEMRKDFRKYDSDNSGTITQDELLQLVNERTGVKVTEKQLALMMKDCDDDSDGRIDYEEFCKMMTKSFMKKRVVATRRL